MRLPPNSGVVHEPEQPLQRARLHLALVNTPFERAQFEPDESLVCRCILAERTARFLAPTGFRHESQFAPYQSRLRHEQQHVKENSLRIPVLLQSWFK